MRGLIRFCWVMLLLTTAFRGMAQDEAYVDSSVQVETVEAPDSEVTETTDEVQENTQTYRRKYMDQGRLASLRSKKEFKYPDLENDTLQLKESSPSASSPGFQGFDPTIFLWLILALAVVVIALQLSGINMRQLFGSKARLRTGDNDAAVTENIHDIQFDKAIAAAIAQQNYSAATRLMYLQSLKIMADKKIIQWHENKTNAQYAYEIQRPELRNAYRGITLVFEYVQYGQVAVTEAHFDIIRNMFNEFRTLTN